MIWIKFSQEEGRMVVGELVTCAASELAENLAEELGVRLVKKEAASIAVAFLTTEALKVCLIQR